MTRINISDKKANIPELVGMLKSGREDIIYITLDGVNVAQLTLVPGVAASKADVSRRIGFAKDKIVLPDDFDDVFDSLDGEIAELFENGGEL